MTPTVFGRNNSQINHPQRNQWAKVKFQKGHFVCQIAPCCRLLLPIFLWSVWRVSKPVRRGSPGTLSKSPVDLSGMGGNGCVCGLHIFVSCCARRFWGREQRNPQSSPACPFPAWGSWRAPSRLVFGKAACQHRLAGVLAERLETALPQLQAPAPRKCILDSGR